MGHVGSKTRSLGQILEKPCMCCRGHIFSQKIVKLCQNVCVDIIRTSLKVGHVGAKTRPLGQILEKPCVCCRGHIFSQIIIKLGQNVCVGEIWTS